MHTHSRLPATPKILQAQKHCTIAPISSGSIWPCALMCPFPKQKNPAVSAQNVPTRTLWGAPNHSQRPEIWNNSGPLVPFHAPASAVLWFEKLDPNRLQCPLSPHLRRLCAPLRKHSKIVAQKCPKQVYCSICVYVYFTKIYLNVHIETAYTIYIDMLPINLAHVVHQLRNEEKTQTNNEISQPAWGFLGSTVPLHYWWQQSTIKGTADEQHFAPGNTKQWTISGGTKGLPTGAGCCQSTVSIWQIWVLYLLPGQLRGWEKVPFRHRGLGACMRSFLRKAYHFYNLQVDF